MNVFSTIDNPTWAIELTEDNYIRKTGRDQRYVRQKGAQRKARYALCPKCQGPIMLINYIIPQTETEVLYGKHVQYNVEGLANYSQHAYENCPLKNPGIRIIWLVCERERWPTNSTHNGLAG